MKSIYNLILFFILFVSGSSVAQDISGTWVGGIEGLPLVFEFQETSEGLSGKLQSPKQSKQFIAADETRRVGDSIFLRLDKYKIKYKGLISGKELNGIFSQGPADIPMVFTKGIYKEKMPNRPQTPKAPFAYQVEEVTFSNPDADNIKLAGTLTLPPGIKQPPVAILISGSGPQDRDETIFEHKPFMVLADHLTKNGIAVLRFDDRGVGNSEGNHSTATSADFATDVNAAVAYLMSRGDVDEDKIGLIGHSEGGLIAPIAITNDSENVAFFISMAGPGVRGIDALLPQLKRKAQLEGNTEADIAWESEMMSDLLNKIVASGNMSATEIATMTAMTMAKHRPNASAAKKSQYPKSADTALAQQFSSDWMRFFLSYDPTSDLEKIEIPTLLLNGSLDYQIIPAINLSTMESKIKSNGNDDVTAIEFEGLNHLFQEASTGAASEYNTIDQTLSPKVLKTISNWINERF